jgi:hypothetical protein
MSKSLNWNSHTVDPLTVSDMLSVSSFISSVIVVRGESVLVVSRTGHNYAVICAYLMMRFCWSFGKCSEFMRSRCDFILGLDIRKKLERFGSDLRRTLSSDWSKPPTDPDELILHNTYINSYTRGGKLDFRIPPDRPRSRQKRVAWATNLEQASSRQMNRTKLKSILKFSSFSTPSTTASSPATTPTVSPLFPMQISRRVPSMNGSPMLANALKSIRPPSVSALGAFKIGTPITPRITAPKQPSTYHPRAPSPMVRRQSENSGVNSQRLSRTPSPSIRAPSPARTVPAPPAIRINNALPSFRRAPSPMVRTVLGAARFGAVT